MSDQLIDDLAQALMDYLAHEENMPLLQRPEIRDDAITTYRSDIKTYFLPRLWEADYQTWKPT